MTLITRAFVKLTRRFKKDIDLVTPRHQQKREKPMIAAIIVTACLIITVAIIITEKMNRAVIALIGGLVAFFTILISEGSDFSFLVTFLFSGPEENYVNLRTLILIIGISFIIHICKESGLFQYLAFTIIKVAGHSAKKLMAIQCLLAVVLASVLNNVLTVMIVIPLVIKIANTLNVNPRPYIITQGLIVNLGATLFSISSVPNILITTSAGISFLDFFLNVGIMSLVMTAITIAFFMFIYRKNLDIPDESATILKQFNAWTFVKDRALMIKASTVLVSVMVGFVVIPPEILSPEFIALIGGIILLIISKLKPEAIISKLDIEFLLYLLGIFVVTGAVNHVKVLELLATGLVWITGGDSFIMIIAVMWISAYVGTNLDNISVTKILIPVIHSLTAGHNQVVVHNTYYSLAVGTNWGDNLTPTGDNVIVMSLAAKNNFPIKAKDLLKLGFYATNLQFLVMTVFYALLFRPVFGLVLLVVTTIALLLFILIKVKYKKAAPKAGL